MTLNDIFCFLTFHYTDEELEIDLVEEEPPFLRGQTKWSMNMSPVKIVKVCIQTGSSCLTDCEWRVLIPTVVVIFVRQNPDGSLSQAAMMQNALSKERRELKQAARAAEMDLIPTGLHKNWIDPMPDCKQTLCKSVALKVCVTLTL